MKHGVLIEQGVQQHKNECIKYSEIQNVHKVKL